MKIHNTVPYFLENYQSSVEFLNDYHAKFAMHFKEYFMYHCYQPELKKEAALTRYPDLMKDIEVMSDKISSRVAEIVKVYEQKYKVHFDRDVHVIVGCFGSTAFTHRQIFPEITFCLEKLSPEDVFLNTIIAHEFGHALQNLLSDQHGMDWSKLDWQSPYVMLLQEGTATYLSRQMTEAPEASYFSFNASGEEWLEFAKMHESELAGMLLTELDELSTAEIFREWFAVNGEGRLGQTHLAYYLGYRIVENLVRKHGELETITLWKQPGFEQVMQSELVNMSGQQNGAV